METGLLVCAAVVFLVITPQPYASGSCRFDALQLNPFSTSIVGAEEDGEDRLMRDNEKETWYKCYSDGLATCWCTDSVLDCSENNGSLPFVPRVNGTILTLNFTYNNLKEIVNDFFLNVTSITTLDLSDNKELASIHPQAFKPLENLQKLSLSYVYNLNYSVLAPIFSVPSLTVLNIQVGDLGRLPNGLFHNKLQQLRSLNLNENSLRVLNVTVLRDLKNLRELRADNNYLAKIYPDTCPQLEILHIRYNRLSGTFPTTCRKGSSTSYYPKLKRLYLMENNIRTLTNEVCLPNLQYLELSKNAIMQIHSGAFSARLFPRLQDLYMHHVQQKGQTLKIEARAFSNPALRTVSFMGNDWLMDSPHVSPDAFQGSTGIENLLLGLNTITNGMFIQLTRDMTILQYVHLGHNDIQEITMETFAAHPNLSIVCLYENRLSDIPDGMFDHLHGLTVLEVNKNSLQTVRPSTFSDRVQQGLRHLDLSNNPFHCNCDIMWFRSWLISYPWLFHDSQGNYTCTGDPSAPTLTAFNMAQQACLLPRQVNVFIIVVIVLLIGGGMVVAVLFRYRWHIRLVLHETFRPQGWGAQRRQRADDFYFDVFVSYAEDDMPWVRQHLMPELEGRQGLRLCVHQRDFIPGMYIVDNIVRSVKTSRKILMIFSDSFARSPWCQFELALCLDHVIQTDDALVVVRLQAVMSRRLTLPMMAVFHTTTYIQWENDGEAIASFWGRLHLSLSELSVNKRRLEGRVDGDNSRGGRLRILAQ